MSMRPMIYPVSSLEPIRKAIGSKDSSLVDRIADAYAKLYDREPDPESLDRVRKAGQSLVDGKSPTENEPGTWLEAIHFAARGLGLLQSKYPVNEDWAWMAWLEYFEQAGEQLPSDARQFLQWLVEGRPFQGPKAEADGAYYAWLESQEVERLLDALAELHECNPELATDIDGFGEELAAWLETCRGKALLLIAS